MRRAFTAPTALAALAAAAQLACAGCASPTYDRDGMQSRLQALHPELTSARLDEIQSLEPTVTFPARIAVGQPGGARVWSGQRGWSADELEIIEAFGDELVAAGVASEVVVLPISLLTPTGNGRSETDLEALRLGAARVHADLLLLIDVVTDTDEWSNVLSVLDLTIVGMWLAPGQHRAALTMVEGLLIDNENEYLYSFARGEGSDERVRPRKYADASLVREKSRREALARFGDAFVREASKLARE